VSRCPWGRCSGRTWTPPPLETLPPPAHSRARQLALVVLRAQLLIAVPGCLWGTSGKGGFRSGGFAGRSGASPHWRFPPSRPAWPGLRDSVPGRRRPPLRNDNRRAIFRPASTTTRSGETPASWPKEQSWCTAWRARSLLSWTKRRSDGHGAPEPARCSFPRVRASPPVRQRKPARDELRARVGARSADPPLLYPSGAAVAPDCWRGADGRAGCHPGSCREGFRDAS
jgi:hypothetical protein